jgi:glycosyltransferase involved in cell wall biosynthesis
VDYESPTRHFRIYTLERLWFNRGLRPSRAHELTIGFDMDGYRIAGPGHIASLKGVIADEVRFERGLTRATMSVQARCERLHVHRAERVLVTSEYSADRACEFYGLKERPSVVPELIDLANWKQYLADHPASASRFTVLSVGRFYLRKRVDVLLRSAAILRQSVPDLEVRIVGNGPCNEAWRKLAGDLKLENTVTWLGDVSRAQLAEEYNRCHVFCLPSVQEGFGIVLLEAMAAGKPIVAAHAGAAPEVAPHATLVAPDNAEALADGLRSPGTGAAGLERVQEFDAARVAARFLEAVTTDRRV